MASITSLPAFELNYFARWLGKATEEYFKDPDVQRRFEEWKKEQRNKSEGE